MAIEKYTSLTGWISKHANRDRPASPDVAATEEGRAALAALNDLDAMLRSNDADALHELVKMRLMYMPVRKGAEDEDDGLYDMPQTD